MQNKVINAYGINLTPEEIIEWAKREKTTYLEFEIPIGLRKRLSKLVEKEIKSYRKNKSN